MIERTFEVKNPTGLHLRPAGMLCDVAQKYKAHISFQYRGDSEANAKSVLSILGAEIKYGDTVKFICDGPDEKEAMADVTHLFESKFEEK